MSDMMTNTAVSDEADFNATEGQYLVFFLDGQEYAIAIEFIVDIINVQPITKVPNCPDFVIGITNLRGKFVPIIDMRLRFGKPQVEYTDRTCIIVLEDMGESVGLVIDSVSEVIDLDDSQISPPPSFNQSYESRFIQGIGKAENGIKLILDCKTVLDDRLTEASEEDEE
ncbi:MAG: chemotaxis protein CheW [Oscillospiraceae bacterium]|jgi:purine-binding chemotaxis protein CheW|nr:chemotaxis protein CheW [Oscillospiraceae bacterium]